jgi:hypothetical protein
MPANTRLLFAPGEALLVEEGGGFLLHAPEVEILPSPLRTFAVAARPAPPVVPGASTRVFKVPKRSGAPT